MILYKYARASSANLILDGLRLKVTPPNELNDPFELTPCSREKMRRQYLLDEVKNNPEHFRKMFQDMIEHGDSGGTFEEFIAGLPDAIRRSYRPFLQQYRGGLIEHDLRMIHEASNHLLLLCLSAVNNSIPMWSHYANHHRGVVIGLETSDCCFQVRLGLNLAPVKYSAKRVALDMAANSNEKQLKQKLIEMVLTKSRDWEYEKEYRLGLAPDAAIKSQRKDGGFNYFMHIYASSIREVVFGHWISASDKAQIEELLALPRFRHVQLFDAKRNGKRFKIDVEPCAG